MPVDQGKTEKALEHLKLADEQGLESDELIAKIISEFMALSEVYNFDFDAILKRAVDLSKSKATGNGK